MKKMLATFCLAMLLVGAIGCQNCKMVNWKKDSDCMKSCLSEQKSVYDESTAVPNVGWEYGPEELSLLEAITLPRERR